MIDRLAKFVRDTQIWQSVFRHGYPDNDRNQSLIMFSSVLLHLHPVKIRRSALRFRYTMCLGGLSAFMFLLLTFTGIFLMFYYVPDTRQAFQNIKDITSNVFMGGLMRDLHKWSAEAMVFLVWMHMFRVFMTGSYKAPREFNWGIGVILLTLTLLLSWTGYLLPWDQLALWAITVGTKMAEATPFFGYAGPWGQQLGMRVDNDIRFLLIGGTVVGQSALLRFYVLHCVALPVLITLGMVVHFWRIRKDGFSGPL
ncbi:MAG: cytochrome b N-terminal domain-containing protein [Nitrospirota bacterium]|nr:cytochrome b N-terminal domain-containing protein [Nitrospirota bacterium]